MLQPSVGAHMDSLPTEPSFQALVKGFVLFFDKMKPHNSYCLECLYMVDARTNRRQILVQIK